MDEENSRTIINKEAANFETPIDKDRYTYVRNTQQYVVDNEEFKLIEDIIKFIRNRERGLCTIEIHTHNGKRQVLVDYADRQKYDLPPATT